MNLVIPKPYKDTVKNVPEYVWKKNYLDAMARIIEHARLPYPYSKNQEENDAIIQSNRFDFAIKRKYEAQNSVYNSETPFDYFS